MPKQTPSPRDPGLAEIEDLERCIIAAHDQRIDLGASAEEVARFRPEVVAQAAAVCDQLRAEYLERTKP